MHPQLGRSLRHPSQVLARRVARKKAVKKAAVAAEEVVVSYKCSKCPADSADSAVFEDQAKFYAHVLVCGGDEAWDPSKKKGNKKKKSNNNSSNASSNNGGGTEKKKTELTGKMQ